MKQSWRQAAVAGDRARLAKLLGAGVEINSRDRYGQTALMLASLHGHIEAVRLLVDQGAMLDVAAKYSLSALMLAIVNRHEAIARHLIDVGADVAIVGAGAPGFAGKTAYDLALENELPEIAAAIAKRQSGMR